MQGQNVEIIWLLAFFVGAFLLSFLINAFLLSFVKNLGIRDQKDIQVRWSKTTKPSLGGISFYVTFLVGFVFYAIIFGQSDVFQNKQLLSLFFTSTLAFLLGLSDDAYNTKPWLKLGVQIFSGIVLILTGTGIELFNQPIIDGVLTVVWVVGIMNSINMLDNMDGITSITSIFIIIVLISQTLKFSLVNNVDIFLLILILGTLMAFLTVNFPPSKMFMGDTGSQFIGMFLAFYSIRLLWNHESSEISNDTTWVHVVKNLILVVGTFALPIIDTTTVSINRLLRGQSPMVGGKDHTTHHLVYKGLSEKQVALVFVAMGALMSVLVYFNCKKWMSNFWGDWIVISVVIIAFSYIFSLTRKQNGKIK